MKCQLSVNICSVISVQRDAATLIAVCTDEPCLPSPPDEYTSPSITKQPCTVRTLNKYDQNDGSERNQLLLKKSHDGIESRCEFTNAGHVQVQLWRRCCVGLGGGGHAASQIFVLHIIYSDVTNLEQILSECGGGGVTHHCYRSRSISHFCLTQHLR